MKSAKSKKPYVWVEQAKVISAMRRIFRTYPPYKEVLEEAKSEYFITSKHGKKLRRVQFTCAACGKKVSRKLAVVDHIIPVVDPTTGFVDYNIYAKRLFCAKNNLQVLEKACHNVKSKAEAAIRAKARKEKKNVR